MQPADGAAIWGQAGGPPVSPAVQCTVVLTVSYFAVLSANKKGGMARRGEGSLSMQEPRHLNKGSSEESRTLSGPSLESRAVGSSVASLFWTWDSFSWLWCRRVRQKWTVTILNPPAQTMFETPPRCTWPWPAPASRTRSGSWARRCASPRHRICRRQFYCYPLQDRLSRHVASRHALTSPRRAPRPRERAPSAGAADGRQTNDY